MSKCRIKEEPGDLWALLGQYGRKMVGKRDDLRVFREFSDALQEEFLKLKDPKDSALAYFLYLNTVDILNNMIEEDSYKQHAFQELIGVIKDEMTELNKLGTEQRYAEALMPLLKIVDKYKRIITSARFINEEEVDLTYDGKQMHFGASLRDDQFCVAARFSPVFFNLDELVISPEKEKFVGSAFLEQIKEAMTQEGVNKLCFIEKLYGPVGAITFLSYLVENADLPAIIYRPGHWNPKSRISGTLRKGDTVCILYDLAVTGDAINAAASFLAKNYRGVKVVSAIVLYDYHFGACKELANCGIRLRSIIPHSQEKIKGILLEDYKKEWDKLNDEVLNDKITYEQYLRRGRELYEKLAGLELFALKSQ